MPLDSKLPRLLLPLIGSLLLAAPGSAQVRISQVYGGGGATTGSPSFACDYIELFNAGASPVNVNGWSVQYASSTGTTWTASALGNKTIAAGGYLLTQQSCGTLGSALPAPDVTGSLAMSATAGKVLLSNTTTSQTGVACGATPANIVDQVSYGPGSSACEGSPTTPNLSNTLAALRKLNGCTDTNVNVDDFANGTPAPRNSASPANPCGAATITVDPATLPTGTVGTLYSQTFSASGGTGPYTFSVTDGTLPSALMLSGSALSGIPGSPGTFDFTITATDFGGATGSRPYTLVITAASTCLPTATISQVQGPGNASPLAGTTVTLQGIVTAARSNGFYLQSRNADQDADPATSEGLFVFTSSSPTVASGDSACVTGPVLEFSPGTDPSSRPVTEITTPNTVSKLSSGNPLPTATVLARCTAAPVLEDFECLEGMLVTIPSLTVVAPTQGNKSEANATSTSNGVFFGVTTSTPRPFREPGVELPDALPTGSPANVPRFDGNAERIRVETTAIAGGTALNVSTGAVVTNLLGPLDYRSRTYNVVAIPGSFTTVPGPSAATPLPLPGAGQLTVASMNIERFFDTVNDPATSDVALTAAAFANRLNKLSLSIRTVLNSPDVIGFQEVENLTTLQAIATKVNADSAPATPNYLAFLVEGNDPGGIDVGLLVKSSRVTVDSVTQFGLTATYTDPASGSPATLNDRPPIVLRGSVTRPGSDSAFPFTVVVNHLRSLNGVDDPVDGNRVRTKRAEQALYLANLLQARQASENILSVGDYNAFEFSDGYADLIGIVKGSPAPLDQVVKFAPDVVNPNLTDLIETLPSAGRYTYSFAGSAQSLDHMIVNSRMQPRVARIEVAHVNADFPEVFRSNPAIPERLSDHDHPVAYFNLPLEVTSKVLITRSGYIFNRIQQTYSGSVTLTNRGGATIDGPVHLLIEGLPAGVTLANAAGVIDGKPYVTYSGSIAAGASVALPVRFAAMAPAAINYTPRVFSVNF